MYAWLLTAQNECFVDFNPEVSLEMAWVLQIQSVTRAALRIIVVENALEGLDFVSATQSQVSQRTKFDRPREYLQDDLRTVVQYSTRALVSRVYNTYYSLTGVGTNGNIYEWLRIPEWDKLVDIGRIIDAHGDTIPSGTTDLERSGLIKAQWSIKGAVERLGYYMKYIVNSAFSTPSSDQANIDISRRFYSQAAGFQSTDNIVNGMSHPQMLLTRSFWTRLTEKGAEFESLMSYDINYFALNENLSMLIALFPALKRHYVAREGRCFFDERVFHSQVSGAFILLHDEWVRGDRELELSYTQHLALGLTAAEFKFLPKWAGGEDDETGRVFEDTDLPDAMLGPSGPGPVYHTGETVATETSTIAPSTPTETVSDMVSMTLGNSIAPAVTEDSATADHDDSEYSLVNFSQADTSEDGWLLPNRNDQ